MSQKSLNVSKLSDLYQYDPDTGVFHWKVNRGKTVKAGDPAGCVGELGYVQLRLDNKTIKGHRVAWCLYYWEEPSMDIDHKNGNRADNRISNLRLATDGENMYNTTTPKNNTSGVKGVAWNERKGKWVARVSVGKVRKFLGYFEGLQEAADAVQSFRLVNHGEFANDGL